MPTIEYGQRDLLRGKVVEPAWYRMRIEGVGEAMSKDGGSTNYPVEGTILFNGENGSTQFQGVPIDWNFNSKAIGFSVGFLAAFGIEPQQGKRYELNNAAGKELDVYVENDTWQGRVVNRVNHKYRSPKSEVTAVST